MALIRGLKEQHVGEIDDLDSEIQDLDSERLKLENPDTGASVEYEGISDYDSESADGAINQYLQTGDLI